MKKTVIIIAHPAGNHSSTQQFLYQTAKAYTQADQLVLAEELTEQNSISFEQADQHRQKLIQYERIIIQFPMYWYQAPSLLKFWLDSVLQDYQSNISWAQQLQGVELGIVMTLDVAQTRFQPGGDVGVTIQELLTPYEALANYYHMKYIQPFTIHRFSMLSEKQKMNLMLQYASYVTTGQIGSLASYQAFILDQLHRLSSEQLPLNSTEQMTYQLWSSEIEHQADELLELFQMNGRWL